MKFNVKRFVLVFMLCEVMFLATGCGNTITQIGALLPAIGTLLSAVVAFISGLGTSLPEAVQNEIKTISTAAQAGIAEAEILIKGWTQSTSDTVLGKIGDILTSITGSLDALLANLNVTGPALQKVTELVGLAIAAVRGVLALLPVFHSASKASAHQLAHMDKMGAAQVSALHSSLKERYKEIVSTPTGDATVDALLAKLPQSL